MTAQLGDEAKVREQLDFTAGDSSEDGAGLKYDALDNNALKLAGGHEQIH